MSMEQVIEQGKAIQKPDLGLFSEFSFWGMFILIALLVIGFGLIVHGFISSEDMSTAGVFLFMIGIMWMFMGFISSFEKEEELYVKEIVEWKEEVAFPFINSLEAQQKEVVFIKIEPELSQNTEGKIMFGTGTISSSAVEKTPITVSFKDGGVITRTDWVETRMELTDETKPFIQFQRVTKDLGHGITAGYYNPKVYLPESYEFTDIK